MNNNIISYFLLCAAFGLLYYFSGGLGLLIDSGFPGVTPLWPPSGIMLLVFLLKGIRYWPAVFIGIGLLAYQNEIPVNVALIAASGNTVEALLAWYLLQKVNFKLSFTKVKQANYFSFIAVLAPLVSASLGAMAMIMEMSSSWSDFGFIWAMWWLGDMTGILLIVPFVLVWRLAFLNCDPVKALPGNNSCDSIQSLGSEYKEQSFKSYIQLFVLLILLGLVSWYSFTPHDLGPPGQLALFYLIMPLTVLAAIMWSQKGATLATLIVASVLLYAYHPHWDTFAINDERLNLLLVIAFIGITVVTSLLVAALFSERYETERSLLESHKNLAESELRLRQLSENIKEVFWLNDLKTSHVIYVSPSYKDVWGGDVDDLLCQRSSWQDLIHPDDLDKVFNEFEAFRRGGSYDIVYRIIRADGGLRWIHDKGFPVFDDKGELYRLAGVAEDITKTKITDDKNKKQQEELARLSRYISVGELGTSLAHEISQPLTSIVCYSQGALSRLASNKLSQDEIETTFNNLSAEATRAGNIVKKIRSLVNRQETRLSTVDVHEVLLDTIELVKGKAKDELVVIDFDYSAMPPYIIADTVLLQQAIINLIFNAIEAMHETPSGNRNIHISTQVNRGMLSIKVCDTGPGVAEENRKKIMQPLFTTKNEGIGLGLSITFSIIESMGGRLLNYPNIRNGHCFEINLPLKKDS